MSTATDIMDEELAKLAKYAPKRIKLPAGQWGKMTDAQMSELLGLPENRPLMPYRVNGRLRSQNKPKTEAEINFLKYCTNLLFNLGEEPFQVTEPPGDEWLTPETGHPRRNLLWRAMVTAVMSSVDPNLPTPDATYADLVVARCRETATFFINGFCWAYDPRAESDYRTSAFVLWPKQVDLVNLVEQSINDGGDVPITKSREVGVSYVLAFIGAHRLAFHKDSGLITSLDEESLDNWTSRSFFGKIRDALKYLPDWMFRICFGIHPKIFWERHNQCSVWAHLRRPEPIPGTNHWQATGESIQGRCSTATAGISTRVAFGFFDEFPLIGMKHPGMDVELWDKSEDSTRCRVSCGTPRRRDTYHQKLLESAESAGTSFESRSPRPLRAFRITWQDDPRKNRPLFRIPVRPVGAQTPREEYGILRRLYRLEASGRRDSEEWRDLMKRCRPLSPKEDAAEFNRLFSPWYLDKCFERSATAEGARSIRTEIDAQCEESEAYLFRSDILETMPIERPHFQGDFENMPKAYRIPRFVECAGNLLVWKKPEAGRWYLVTGDAGNGVGCDYSVAIAWDVTNWPVEQVAMFRDNRTGPTMFAYECIALAMWYKCADGKPAFSICERNAEAAQTITKMLELGFPSRRMYHRAEMGSDDPDQSFYYGWLSTGDGRLRLIGDYHEQFESPSRPIVIHAEVMKNEMSRILASRDLRYQPDVKNPNDDTVVNGALTIPGLRGFNAELFGGALFDVMGERANIAQEARDRRADAMVKANRKWLDERHPKAPIYKRERAYAWS